MRSYTDLNNKTMEDIIEALMNGDDANWYAQIEKTHNCRLEVWHEKHHELQFTYYANIYAGNEVMSVEIESGINNGTCERERWEYANGWSNTKEERELIDYELSYTVEATENQIAIAQLWLKNMKQWLHDRHRKECYDNYVTGGNAKPLGASNDTDRLNLYRLKQLAKQDIFVEAVYKEVEARKNFELIYRGKVLLSA